MAISQNVDTGAAAAQVTGNKSRPPAIDIDNPDIFKVSLDEASAAFLQSLRAAERVEPITDRHDLATRLGATEESRDRRNIYAWRDPNDPEDGALISVQAAYTHGIPDNIETVIQAKDKVPGKPNTAVFYSISNWERVKGVPLGRAFLMAVVKDIQKNHPSIRHFVTLSPMPGFRKWVEGLTPEELIETGAVRSIRAISLLEEIRGKILEARSLKELQATGGYYKVLKALAAYYVTHGRMEDDKRNPGQKKFAGFDSVAQFHLGNGAAAGRLCEGADTSQKGFEQSFGFMMNYVYAGNLEANVKSYRAGDPAMSKMMERALLGARRPATHARNGHDRPSP